MVVDWTGIAGFGCSATISRCCWVPFSGTLCSTHREPVGRHFGWCLDSSLGQHAIVHSLSLPPWSFSPAHCMANQTFSTGGQPQPNCDAWSQATHNRLVFENLASLAGPALGPLLHKIMPVFFTNFDPSNDLQVRLNFFVLLAKLLTSAGSSLNSTGEFNQYSTRVVGESRSTAILPALFLGSGPLSWLKKMLVDRLFLGSYVLRR